MFYLSKSNFPGMASSRQLAAIMFTDIVGYTALMGDDEQKAFEQLRKNRELQKPIIEKYGGRWIKELGDGVLACFYTVSDAVNAAIQIQKAINQTEDFSIRIGIHLGEVVFENDDVFGDGVNIASRIQAIARPGAIYISEPVYNNISNKQGITANFVKEDTLKNVKGPVRVYEVITPVPEKSPKESWGIEKNTFINAPDNCVAVLPFINMSSDPEQEYFSDGLTEELISNLTKLKEIRVISRTTSMKYKGTKKDIKTIGMETGASYIMEGSVRKQGSNLRITAQFVDACNDVHLWSETYRGMMDDIFDIQEKVSAKIVEALQIELTRGEKEVIQKRHTENTDAYQLYLQGRYFWNKRNEESVHTAIRYFKKAIDADPGYALAWAGLADAYNLLGEYANRSRREIYPEARAAVNRALEIDNGLAEAHISLGSLIMLNEWDWINSEKEFELGIRLNPNYATGHHWYAEWLLYKGRQAEALQEISLAVSLDPISQAILKDQGIIFYYTRKYDKAIAIAQKTLELDPGFIMVHRLISLCYLAKGMYDEAITKNQFWGELTRNPGKTQVALAGIYAASGRREEALKIVEQEEIETILSGNDYRGVALVYAALRENDKAFFWLEKSIQQHEESLCSIKVDPKMDPIRSDPRFSNILQKIGLLD